MATSPVEGDDEVRHHHHPDELDTEGQNEWIKVLESRLERAKATFEDVKSIIEEMAEEEPYNYQVPSNLNDGDEHAEPNLYLQSREKILRSQLTEKIRQLNTETREYLEKVTDSSLGNDGITTTPSVEDETNVAEPGSNSKEHVKSLVQKFENLKEDIQKKETTITDCQKDIQNLKNEIGKKETTIKDFKEEFENLKKYCSELSEDSTTKKKRILDLEQENENLRNKIQEKETVIRDFQQEIHNLRNQTEVKDTIIKERQEDISNLKKSVHESQEKCKEKETIIQAFQTKIKGLSDMVSKSHGIIKQNKEVMKELQEEIEAKDATIIENQEVMKKLEEDIVAKDAIIQENLPKEKGAALGSFMGSFVTTTASLVSYSTHDLNGFLIVNLLGNLTGSLMGQACNNIVTHISQTTLEDRKDWTKLLLVGLKSLLWTFLGALVPLLAGGFTKTYKLRALFTFLASLFVQICFALSWRSIHKVPKRQVGFIVGLGIFGITIAAMIPHLLQMTSEISKK